MAGSFRALAFRISCRILPPYIEIENPKSVVSDPHSSQEFLGPWLKSILGPGLMSTKMNSTIPDEEPVEVLSTFEQDRRTPVPKFGEERAHHTTNRGRFRATAKQAVLGSGPWHALTDNEAANAVKSQRLRLHAVLLKEGVPYSRSLVPGGRPTPDPTANRS